MMLYRICPACRGSGQAPSDKARSLQLASLPCDACQLLRVVPIASQAAIDLAPLTPESLIALRDQIENELASRDICEHGVKAGDYCEPCNRAYKRSIVDLLFGED